MCIERIESWPIASFSPTCLSLVTHSRARCAREGHRRAHCICALFWARSRFRNPPSLRKSFPDSKKTNVFRAIRSLGQFTPLGLRDSRVSAPRPAAGFSSFRFETMRRGSDSKRALLLLFYGLFNILPGRSEVVMQRKYSFPVAKQKFRCVFILNSPPRVCCA